ncbi:MAG TPA: hypothetical protein VGK59_18605 [Ohtaekwangia sp.]
MKHRIEIIFILVIFGIGLVTFFGEQIDRVMQEVAKFILFLPPIIAVPLCIIGLAIIGTWAVIRSSRNHWPSDTEFQNEDKLPHSED